MTAAQKKAVFRHRRRLKRQGIVRLEVQVRKDDAPLVRDIVNALADPGRGSEARALLRERFGAGPAAGLKALLAAVRAAFAGRILPVDDAVALEWGRMSAGRPVPVIDGLLAATAKVHRLTLATRNTADVADLGAEVVNPFAPAAGK